MKLTYTATDKNSIEVVLNQGETLGNFKGPSTFFIPVVPGNKEYDEVLKRNLSVTDYTPPFVVPKSVTPLQARKALRQFGIYPVFKEKMDAMPDYIQDEWEYSIAIERDNPLIAQFAIELGLSQNDLDTLFQLAATL